jgi:hypothetical protein
VIQGSGFNVLYEVFTLFAKNKIANPEDTIKQLLQSLNKDALNCLAKSVASLVLVSD